MTLTAWQVLRVSWRERADVYHFHDPELIPVGIVLALCGRRVIYDVHEDLPRQLLSKYWVPGWMRWAASRIAAVLEAVGSQLFRGVVAATPTIAARFPARKTRIVHNFPVVAELVTPGRRTLAERPPHAAYIGGIDAIRGIREMVDGVALIPESLDARLVLAGTFDPPELLDSVGRLPGWDKVDYRGWQSRTEVAGLLANVRVGLVVLHPRPNFLDSYPIKLFEYMSAGLPVVVSAFPLWRQIVEGAGCGLVVDPLDPTSISKAVQWLLENPEEAEAMGERGRQAIEAKYNWSTEAEKLTRHYRQILEEA
jgi:glycosyltransferase involved in cell wall biosynthesis